MANIYSDNIYDPKFYALEGLLELEKSLGMARSVYMGYSRERASYGKGSSITITVPGTFTATTSTVSPTQDIVTQSRSITLDRFVRVQFKVPDIELAHGGFKIIEDHIRPAVYALSDFIDQDLMSLSASVPWKVDAQSTPGSRDIINPRKLLRDNNAMLADGNVYMAIDSEYEAAFLDTPMFHAASTTGDGVNESALIRGSLGTRFGVNVFATQNAGLSHTSGTVVSNASDLAGVLDGGGSPVPAATSSITVTGLTATETFVAGDSFTIAGNRQKYTVTSAATVGVGGDVTLSIYPATVVEYADSSVVTIDNGTTSNADDYTSLLLFHRNAIALAVAPLPQNGDFGPQVSTQTTTDGTLSLRATIWYDPDADGGAMMARYDILYGYQLINPNLAALLMVDV